MAFSTLPPAERLRELFRYEIDSGRLVRLIGKGAGKLAGSITSSGYLSALADGKLYQNHRIIWKMMTGNDPVDCIDHINGVRTDNRWRNLRAATRSQNAMNRGIRKGNKLGIKGVCIEINYVAQLNGKRIGRYKTPEAAKAAYEAAAKASHGNFFKH